MRDIYRCRVCKVFTEDRFHCGVEAELFLDGRRREALSKLMSYILRHDPESVGISLGSEGWARIGDLVQGIRARWRNAELYKWVMEEHVKAVAFLDPKQRFGVRDGMIRARYGHSKRLGVGISYEVDSQIKFLYHGTSRQALQSILREGVKPLNRMFVHLTTVFEDACAVGARRDANPVVLVIDADCLRRSGYKVYKATQSIRLVRFVPPKCIERVELCKR